MPDLVQVNIVGYTSEIHLGSLCVGRADAHLP